MPAKIAAFAAIQAQALLSQQLLRIGAFGLTHSKTGRTPIMTRFSIIPLTISLCAMLLHAQDSELTNWKSGIDAVWGVGDGSDKGVAYQEEYWYHDKLVHDRKVVFLRADTKIAMSHNGRNTASTGKTRYFSQIGANGGGLIRYKIDGIWQEMRWAPAWDGTGTLYPAYTSPFTLAGAGVAGKTGRVGSSWAGLTETVGTGTEEWHVLMYADDDSSYSGFVNYGADDTWASDGKYVLLVVNPITPAMTVRASGDGQFYTTPAWTYWVPKIHAQTTFIQGSCTFQLRNIYGENISYRINNGPAVNVGASSTTVSGDSFANGTNTLEYWYTATPSVIRTRTVVKNPLHPSLNEEHGNRVWGGEKEWTEFRSRATRAPYSGRIAAAQLASGNGSSQQEKWETLRRKGLVFGPISPQWPFQNGGASTNAIMAKYLGVDAYRPGAPKNKTYAEYAKEMLLETSLSQCSVGFEADFWTNMSMPCVATVSRGYWDVNDAYSAATAYDILVSLYRSDQVAGGITPIEDHYLRDQLASWVHLAALNLGGFVNSIDIAGMWQTCRAIGATFITCVMPNYSSSYYGTSGMNGNAKVYQWAPFEAANYTWKSMFLEHDHGIHSTRSGPSGRMGVTGTLYDGSLIRPPVDEEQFTGSNGEWVAKVDYASFSQCGDDIYTYANLLYQYSDLSRHSNLLNFIDEITKGTLRGSAKPTGPVRQHALTVLNERFPSAVQNARAWIQSLPSTEPNSELRAVEDAGLGALYRYDDGRSNSGPVDTTPPGIAITSPTSEGSYSTTASTISIGGTASDNEGVASITWSNSLGGSGSIAGSTTWTVSGIVLQQGTNYITLTARDLAGNQGTASIAVTYTGVAVPAAPVISPAGGNFAAPQTVTLTTASSGASIYYTTDGSIPTTSSNRYSSPLTISGNTTLKAIAATSATNASSVATASFRFDEYISSTTWQSVALPSAQIGRFTVSWISTPNGDLINSVTGLSFGPATSYGQLACIVRFNDNGFIDARNGSDYIAEQSLPYSAGTSYRVSMTVDIAAKTYDVIVTPAGGSPVVIAVAYAFRSEQASATTLDHLSFFSGTGSHSLGEILLSSASGPPIGPSGLGLTP